MSRTENAGGRAGGSGNLATAGISGTYGGRSGVDGAGR